MIAEIYFWLYLARASWRLGRGRWYVWRDAPTWAVRRVAILWYLGRKDKDEDATIIHEAYKEYKLRKQKEKNT